jgi:hypothetical protein
VRLLPLLYADVLSGDTQMAPINRTIDDVVQQYVASRRSPVGAISTADATRAIRAVLANAPVTDREIEERLVAEAALRGLAIHLDRAAAA